MEMFSTGSLQNLCLFKVVQQLEYYPPELLACLPPTLRRLLLVHLPVIDVCKLTNTCVFDGIDPETIWEQLYNQHIPRYFISNKIFPLHDEFNKTNIEQEPTTSFRERYLANLAVIILNYARPSGQFGLGYGYNRRRNIALTNTSEKPPTLSFLEKAPTDLVNTLVAGEKLVTVFAETRGEKLKTVSRESDQDNKEESKINIFTMIEGGEIYWYFVPDYDKLDNCVVHEYCLYKQTNDLHQYIPPRYSNFASKATNYRLSDTDAISLLMKKCMYYPEYLMVSAHVYKHFGSDLLRRFLSRLVSLKIFGYCWYTECEELMTTILSDNTPSLSTLELLPGDSEYDKDISFLVHLSQSPPAVLTIVSPLCMLRELYISGVLSSDGLTKLGIFISRQKSLVNFSLHSTYYQREYSQCNSTIASRSFVEALVVFFQSPNFESVKLKHVAIHGDLVQDLVAGFLTSPCAHSQKLALRSLEINHREDGEPHNYESSKSQFRSSDSAFIYKSLVLTVDEYESCDRDIENLVSLLCSLKPLQLNTLKFLCCEKHTHVHDDFLPVLVKNTSLQVTNLSLCWSRVEAIQKLLRNDVLKNLRFKFCSGTIDIEHIAEYILKPLSLLESMSLETLALIEDIYNEENFHTQPFSKESVCLFCDALFSFPHLNQFTLEIHVSQYNQIDHHIKEFIEILHESWKKSGGRKLMSFVLYPSEDTFQMLEGHDSNQDTVLQMANEIGLLIM